jgi:hypothetical protein
LIPPIPKLGDELRSLVQVWTEERRERVTKAAEEITRVLLEVGAWRSDWRVELAPRLRVQAEDQRLPEERGVARLGA